MNLTGDAETRSVPLRVRHEGFVTCLWAVWLLATVSGMAILWNYSSAPGIGADPPRAWPSESSLQPPTQRPSLLMFAHSRCPCTRASIGELDRLMARCEGRVDARVLFFVPRGEADAWAQTDLWEMAQRIPGVLVSPDRGGREAVRFRVHTSGQVLLYQPVRGLVFCGGITDGRGHSGDNTGSSALTQLLRGGVEAVDHTPVYGCALDDGECSAPPERLR
jgi:hypothetical protein